MKRTTLILAIAALAVSGCAGLGPLFRMPSQSGASATLQGIACGPATQVIADGIPVGWELRVSQIFASGQLEILCRDVEDPRGGGQAQRVFVPSTRPSEAQQAQEVVPGQRITIIGDAVTVPFSTNNASASQRLSEAATGFPQPAQSGTRTTIMARSVRLGARR